MYMPHVPIVKKKPPSPPPYPPYTPPRPTSPLVERSMTCVYCVRKMMPCYEGRKSDETVDNRCRNCQESSDPCEYTDCNQHTTSSSNAQPSDALLPTTSDLSSFDAIIPGAFVPGLSQPRTPQMWYHPSTSRQNPLTGAWNQEYPQIDIPVVALPVDFLVSLLTASTITGAQKLFRNRLPIVAKKILGPSPVKLVRFLSSQPATLPKRGDNSNGQDNKGELQKSHPMTKRKSTDMKDDDKFGKTQPAKKSKPSSENNDHEVGKTIAWQEVDAEEQMARDQALAEKLQEEENAKLDKESRRRWNEDFVVDQGLQDQPDVEDSDSESSYEVMPDSEMFGTPRKKKQQKRVEDQEVICINCNSPFSPADNRPICPVHTGSLIGPVAPAPNSDTLEPIYASSNEPNKEQKWDCCNGLAGQPGCKWVKHEVSPTKPVLPSNGQPSLAHAPGVTKIGNNPTKSWNAILKDARKDLPSPAQSPSVSRAPRRAPTGRPSDISKSNPKATPSFSRSTELVKIPINAIGELSKSASEEQPFPSKSIRVFKIPVKDVGEFFKNTPKEQTSPTQCGLVSSVPRRSHMERLLDFSKGNPVDQSHPVRRGLVSSAPRFSPSGQLIHYPEHDSGAVPSSSQDRLPTISSLLDPSENNPLAQPPSSQAGLEARRDPFSGTCVTMPLSSSGKIKIPIISDLPDFSKCVSCGENFDVKLNFNSEPGLCTSHLGTKVPKGDIWDQIPELKPSEFVDDPDWSSNFRWSCCDKVSAYPKCNPHMHHPTELRPVVPELSLKTPLLQIESKNSKMMASDNAKDKSELCGRCNSSFDPKENQGKACTWHTGTKEIEESLWVNNDTAKKGAFWRDAFLELAKSKRSDPRYAEGFKWTCCGLSGDAPQCQSAPHIARGEFVSTIYETLHATLDGTLSGHNDENVGSPGPGDTSEDITQIGQDGATQVVFRLTPEQSKVQKAQECETSSDASGEIEDL